MTETAEKLKAWRKRRNLTQSEAAMLLDASVDTYRNWERGTEPYMTKHVEAIKAKCR